MLRWQESLRVFIILLLVEKYFYIYQDVFNVLEGGYQYLFRVGSDYC